MNPTDFICLIDVSVNPDHVGITRKVGCDIYTHDHRTREFRLFTNCFHFKDGVPYSSKSVANFEKILFGQNARQVDPVDGAELYQDEVTGEWKRYDTNAVIAEPMGQYDFFHMLVMNTPMQIPALIQNMIQFEDSVLKGYDK